MDISPPRDGIPVGKCHRLLFSARGILEVILPAECRSGSVRYVSIFSLFLFWLSRLVYLFCLFAWGVFFVLFCVISLILSHLMFLFPTIVSLLWFMYYLFLGLFPWCLYSIWSISLLPAGPIPLHNPPLLYFLSVYMFSRSFPGLSNLSLTQWHTTVIALSHRVNLLAVNMVVAPVVMSRGFKTYPSSCRVHEARPF